MTGSALRRPPALALLLPGTVVSIEAGPEPPPGPLYPAEEELVARAVTWRQEEFAAARLCARAALSRIGVPPAPLLRGAGGEPLWPPEVVGSITHCPGYRAAAVADARQVAGVGIDAERNQPLPDGVLHAISSGRERRVVAALTAAHPAVCWDRLLFSAKESMFKVWYPMTRRPLPFAGAEVALAADGTFRARLTGAADAGGPAVPRRYPGRWRHSDGLLLTAVTVPAGRRRGAVTFEPARRAAGDPKPAEQG